MEEAREKDILTDSEEQTMNMDQPQCPAVTSTNRAVHMHLYGVSLNRS